jgi:hypothetical protein
MGVSRPRAPLGARYACICICRWIHASAAGYMPGCLGSRQACIMRSGVGVSTPCNEQEGHKWIGNSQLNATSGPSDHRAEKSKHYINRMSRERETWSSFLSLRTDVRA